MVSQSLILLMMLVLFSCQNFGEFKGDGIIRPDVWGKWSSCVSETNNESILRTYSIDGSNIVVTEKYYNSVQCQDSDIEYEDAVYYSYYKYDPNYTLTKIQTKRRALSNLTVSEFNTQSECSYSDWALNTFKIITKISNCDNHEDNPRITIENRMDSFLYIDGHPYQKD